MRFNPVLINKLEDMFLKFIFMLFGIFFIFKIFSIITWSWFWVFSPLLFAFGLGFLCAVILTVLVMTGNI